MNHPEFQPEPAEFQSDVFDMERPHAGAPAANGSPPAPPMAAATPSGLGAGGMVSKIGPLHFGILAAVLAAAWIVWPNDIARQGAATDTNGRLLSTQLRPVIPVALLHASGAPATLEPPLRSEPKLPPLQTETHTAHEVQPQLPFAVSAQIIEQQAQQAASIIAAIDTLNTRLAALEARTAEQFKPTWPAGQALPASDPGARANQRSPMQGRERHRGTVPSAGPILNTYVLNTIFRGQAWVQHAGRMHVVQEGDTIDDLTVIDIDPAARRVLTSRGIIR